MKPSKIEREIQFLKSALSILEKHARVKRKYEKRRERILSLAAIGLPIGVIAKQAGTFPYYVKYTLRRAKSAGLASRVIYNGPVHEQNAAADR